MAPTDWTTVPIGCCHWAPLAISMTGEVAAQHDSGFRCHDDLGNLIVAVLEMVAFFAMSLAAARKIASVPLQKWCTAEWVLEVAEIDFAIDFVPLGHHASFEGRTVVAEWTLVSRADYCWR